MNGWMKRALALARRGRYTTSPNPMVGAVIVDAMGQMVGEGYHKRPGTAHAETIALKMAGPKAQGATLYVTLEPCNHVGRTPACSESIISAGIDTVHIATTDPNPHVKGGGIERLRQAGIKVFVGEGQNEAEQLNRAFITWSRQNRPYIALKAAMTLDGKVATKTGDSKYITHAESLLYVHELRRQYDGILVGVNTVINDNPQLTYRGKSTGRNPVRIILDSTGRTPPESLVFSSAHDSPTLVYTTNQASPDWEREIFSVGGEVITISRNDAGHVDLTQVLQDIASRNVLSLLVEGGPTIHASFIESRLADRWIGFVAPLIVGGSAPTPVQGKGIDRLSDAWSAEFTVLKTLGPDILFEATFTH